jgi:hypothetical protein
MLLPASKAEANFDVAILSDLLHFDALVRSLELLLRGAPDGRTYVAAMHCDTFVCKAERAGILFEAQRRVQGPRGGGGANALDDDEARWVGAPTVSLSRQALEARKAVRPRGLEDGSREPFSFKMQSTYRDCGNVRLR